MDKYIKLNDVINLIDSKINRMEEFVCHNNISSNMLNKIENQTSILLQLKFEILQDNMMTFTNGE